MANNHLKIHKGVTLPPQTAEPTSPTDGDMYYDDTLSLFRVFQNGSWIAMVTSNAGGINHITNPDSEANLDDWNTYFDAADTRPVDGTGGSPNVVLSRITSGQLRGNGSFRVAKDAVNRQGEGVSI